MSFRKLGAVAGSGIILGLVGAAVAQQQQPPAQPRPGVQVQVPGVGVQVGGQPLSAATGQRAHGQVTDHSLATCMAIENQEEIDLARFAEGKAKKKDVQEFARMIAKDHQSFLQKLERFAPEATREGYLTQSAGTQAAGTANQRGRSGESVQTEAPRNTVGGKAQPQGEAVNPPGTEVRQNGPANSNAVVQQGIPVDFVQLHREIAQECLTDTKETLSKKDAREFDECFIRIQIAKHHAMKDKLTVFQRHASGELAQIIADGLQTTESHLKKAESIMKRLSDSTDNQTTSNK